LLLGESFQFALPTQTPRKNKTRKQSNNCRTDSPPVFSKIKGFRMLRKLLSTALACSMIVAPCGFLRAEGEQKTIEDKGLKKSGSVFVLPGEAEIETKQSSP
jgi:hypothetical protein